MISFLFRSLAWIWSVLLVLFMIQWGLVHLEYYPKDSKWLALGFFPPFWFILFVIPPVWIFFRQRYRKTWKSLLLIYLVFFISFGDFLFVKRQTHQFSENTITEKISVIALNLRYYSYGFQNVVNAINDMDADIYLLSENDITSQQIIDLKTMVSPKEFHMGKNEGTAIISRFPVTMFKEVEFPTRQASLYKGNEIEELGDNPHRSFVHAIVDVNGTLVHAISVRFIAGRAKDRSPKEVLKFGFYVLEQQLKEVDFFLDYLSRLEGPVIFGGDLNATATSYTLKELSKVATDAYMQDHTWGGFTFWTNFPSYARLDYLFSMNEVEPVRSEKLDIIVSDHYPVRAEFLVPGN